MHRNAMVPVIFALFVISAKAQIYKPNGFYIISSDISKEVGTSKRPLGNAMVDMVTKDSLLWAGSGYGLSRTSDGGSTWTTFYSRDYLGKGGISAMALMDDSTFWIASAFDTSIQDIGNLDAGSGLSYTRDYGKTWTHIKQPIDRRDETEYSPTTTIVQNLTFDIAFTDSIAWIASWGGGLRKSLDMGQTWKVVTVDGDTFNVNAEKNPRWRNHVAFSVMVENNNIWVGTASGIHKSADLGTSWRTFNHTNQDLSISGNFVVAIAYQPYTKTIWAATIEADTDPSEFRAVSKSENGGETWDTMLAGRFAHNFAFNDSVVYVATDSGMYVSNDQGQNWYILPRIYDFQTSEELLDDEYFSAAVSAVDDVKQFWAGNADGLASTINNGNTWRVHRSFRSTRESQAPRAYAYPSPFSPSRHDYIRFQYDITQGGEVIIDIYDYVMDHVATIREHESSPLGETFDRSAKWNGTNDAGLVVASGVYLFRVNIEGKITWGKLVIIN